MPDPDAALLGFCRYVATRTPKAGFIGNLHADPRMLEILTQMGQVLLRQASSAGQPSARHRLAQIVE